MRLKFWKRCFICKGYEDLYKIVNCPWGDCNTHYFHKKCIEDVLCNPELYSSFIINKCREIIDTMKLRRKRRENYIKDAKKACDELKNL